MTLGGRHGKHGRVGCGGRVDTLPATLVPIALDQISPWQNAPSTLAFGVWFPWSWGMRGWGTDTPAYEEWKAGR